MSRLMRLVVNEARAPGRKASKDLGEGMFRTSLEGTYLAVNPALAEIYGYDSPQQMMDELRDIQRQLRSTTAFPLMQCRDDTCEHQQVSAQPKNMLRVDGRIRRQLRTDLAQRHEHGTEADH